MNTDLRKKKAKHNFGIYFFMLINNAVFRKPMENGRKKETYLLPEPN